MSTIARPLTRSAAHARLGGSLRFALADWADTLAAGVSSAISREIKSPPASAAVIRKAIKNLMPSLLEEAFRRGLIENESGSRKQRAVLIHLLSAADAGAAHAAPAGFIAAESADDATLTSEQAATLLHMSRTHLNSLLDTGKLGLVVRTAGGHRRIAKAAVVAYKQECEQRQARGLEAMTQASRSLGLYQDELQGIPRRSTR